MKIFKKCTVKDPGLDPETDFNAPETENLMDIFRGYMVIIFLSPQSITGTQHAKTASIRSLSCPIWYQYFVVRTSDRTVYFIKDCISIDLSKILKCKGHIFAFMTVKATMRLHFL